MPNTDIPCYHCQNMKFRFLYPTGDNAQGDTDIIVCVSCGAEAPDNINDDQIIND